MYLFYGFCKNGLKYVFAYRPIFHAQKKKPTLGSKIEVKC